MTKIVITAKDMLKYETVSQMKADLDNLTGTLRHLNDEDPKIFQDDFYGPYMKDLLVISNNHLETDLEDIYNEVDRLTKLVESLQQSTGQPIIEEQKITIDGLTKEKFRLMDRNCELFELNSILKNTNETLKSIIAKKDKKIDKLEGSLKALGSVSDEQSEKINKLEASLKSEEEWSKKLWDENEALQKELAEYKKRVLRMKNAEDAYYMYNRNNEDSIRHVSLLDTAPPNLKKLCDSLIDGCVKGELTGVPVVSITRAALKEYNELEAKYQSACGQISEYEEENRKLKEKLEEINKLVKTTMPDWDPNECLRLAHHTIKPIITRGEE